MALWICEGCKTAYAVDAPACPHCGGTDHTTDHDTVTAEPEPASVPTPVKK